MDTTQARKALSTDLSVLIAAVVENNPEAVNQNLVNLKLTSEPLNASEMKMMVDTLYNTKQYAKFKETLNVRFLPGVLPLEYDGAAQDLIMALPRKKSGNGETVANWTPLVDSVLDFVCQMFGNCQQVQQGGGQPPPQPFNWMPVYIIGGIFGAVVLGLLAVVAFKK